MQKEVEDKLKEYFEEVILTNHYEQAELGHEGEEFDSMLNRLKAGEDVLSRDFPLSIDNTAYWAQWLYQRLFCGVVDE